MTTREQIIETANREHGGYVNTDGAWCNTRTPEEFKQMLEEKFGFEVIECKATANSTAVALTKDGLKISWNGYCRK